MKFKSLKLNGFARMMQNNIREFTIKPEKQLQLVLGSNGCGKSSLLDELSPLPANRSDYLNGGYKIIEIEHKGSLYTLTSDFSKGAKHSFIVDDVEYNEGGTQTVQKELCLKHFNYDDELHNIVKGHLKFTQMAPAKRREIITNLSDNDLTYALKVYNTFKGKLRDLQGAIKLAKQRLGTETNKLQSMSDISGLEERVSRIKREVDLLLELRDNGVSSSETLEKGLESLMLDITNTSTVILEALSEDIPYALSSYSELLEYQRELQDNIKIDSNTIELYGKEHQMIEEQIQILKQSGANDVEELKRVLENGKIELSDLKDQISGFEITANVEDTVSMSNSVVPELLQLVYRIPTQGEYGREILENARNRRLELQREIDSAKNQLARNQVTVERITEHLKNPCENCGYIKHIDNLRANLNDAKEAVETLTNKLGVLEKDLDITEYIISTNEDFAIQVRQFRSMASTYTLMAPLFRAVLDAGLWRGNREEVLNVIDYWKDDVEYSFKVSCLKNRLEPIERALNDLTGTGTSTHNYHFNRLEELSEASRAVTVRIRETNEELKVVSYWINVIQNIDNHYNRLNNLEQDFQNQLNALGRSIQNDMIREVIGKHQETIGINQKIIHEVDTQRRILKDIENNIAFMEVQESACKSIVFAMSPTDGLIAEQLMGFINCLVMQINDVIREVWVTDLEVMPCGLESGELDYKFPVNNSQAETPVPDIAKGSQGQQDVIDFAFMLVYMLYRGLSEYPLSLDELGASFDPKHRGNLMNYIKKLADASTHSQIFLISHYASEYSVFSNADVCVIDGANITVPQQYNDHVTIL